MNRFFKIIVSLLLLAVIGIFGYTYITQSGFFKKPLSPKDTIEFRLNDLKLTVFYNRPSKRNRDIFGGLVPFNKVWRTGANEATTFETNKDLTIGKAILPKGKYTLWTIPNKDTWDVIFNSKQYPWGVNEANQVLRDSIFDVLIIPVFVTQINHVVEQFTIAFDNSTDNLSLTMAWDTTKIVVPLK